MPMSSAGLGPCPWEWARGLGLGFRGLGFRLLGFRGLGFRGLGV